MQPNMSAADLIALAERCEAASGPDRELDREIKQAVGHSWDYAADWGPRGHDKPTAYAYTASLDAAMTLAQPNWWLRINGPLSPDAYGYSRESDREIRAAFDMIGPPYCVGGRHKSSLALALTAASLRALAKDTPMQPDAQPPIEVTPPDDIDAVVRSLPKVASVALLKITSPDWVDEGHPGPSRDGVYSLGWGKASRHGLIKVEWRVPGVSCRVRLTPLGLAVRARLQEQHHA